VTITNINEAPVIGAFTSAATASYSVTEGTSSLFNMNGSDEDANPTLTYSLTGGDAAQFSINSSGVLSFISARNYENALDVDQNNSYLVTVGLSDGALTDSQTLTITVTDSNEAPTITINASGATHAISIAENSVSVITYIATDVDSGSALTWSISGTDSAFFTINSATGTLVFTSAPDYEDANDAGNNNSYVVIVTVSDGALTDAQTLTITITNVSESGSISAPSVSGTAYKGVAITITVTTNSPGKVRFLVGGKRISNCLSKATTGNAPTYTATCSWKPAIHGKQFVTAQLTPSNSSFTAATSAQATIWVFRRSGTRS
jgi:VCBS repeat-containing protein